ncbi:MAG: DUF177 domain-containing protein [Coriobacteriia bacterium]|nr:DUF177 domain-containing protein [Coriobacteriia bacterium]
MGDPAPETLLLDVAEILHATAGSLHQTLELDLGSVDVGPVGFAPIGPVHVDITLTYAGTAVVAEGTVDATVRTACVRCLGDVDLAIHGAIEGFYIQHGTEHDLPEEQEYEFIEGTAVDVLPAVRSALILELPFAPVHPGGCQAVCPQCGEGVDSCMCGPEGSDSPFSALKDLFPNPGP